MANITITETTPVISVNTSSNVITVTNDTSNITVSNVAVADVAQIREALSVTDTGGDGSLTYANTTGVFTYTGPSAAEVRAHLSNTAPVEYNSSTGVISLDTEAVFSNTLANAWFTSQTTDDLTEGSNLYYTTDRANSAIGAYTGGLNNLTGNVDISGGTGNIVLSNNNFIDAEVGANINLGKAAIIRLDGSNFRPVSNGGGNGLNVKGSSIGDGSHIFERIYGNVIHANIIVASNSDLKFNDTASTIRLGDRTQYPSIQPWGHRVGLELSGNVLSINDEMFNTSNSDLSNATIMFGPTTILSGGPRAIAYTDIGGSNGSNATIHLGANVSANAIIGVDSPISIGSGVINFRRRNNAPTEDNFIFDGNTLQYGNITTTANVMGTFRGDVDSNANITTTANVNSASFTTTANATVGANLNVLGNLEVTGNINYREVEDLLVRDQTITLNFGNASANDVQIISDRSGSGDANTDIKWNETSDTWTFTNDGSTYYAIPTSTSDLAEGTNLYYTTARQNTDFDTRLATKDTDNLSEGSSNLYFTDSRSRAALSTTTTSASGGGALAYDSGTGVFTFTPADTQTDSEVRALLSVGTPATPSGNGSLAYDNSTGVFTLTPADVPDTTDELTEGSTNLYYTSARADADIADYTGAIINMTGNLTTTANISADTVLTDNIESGSSANLNLKGQADGIHLNTTVASTESRIVDVDTTGYNVSSFDFGTANITTDNVPALLVQISGSSGASTVTAAKIVGGFTGSWAGVQNGPAGSYNTTSQGGTEANFEDFIANFLGGNGAGWTIFYPLSGGSTTSTMSSMGHVTSISGNTINLSENLTQAIVFGSQFGPNVGYSAVLFPNAYSSTQNIGISLSGDTTNSSIPFTGATVRTNKFDLPQTLSNVTLDKVSYGDATVDMANVTTVHSADLLVGENSGLRTERLLMIGANVTPDALSIGLDDVLPAPAALGVTLENDGETFETEVNTAPQMKFLMNQYTENALSSFSTYPLWTEFLGETSDANVDMKYLGAPLFNFKMLGGTKTDKKPVKSADVLGRIGWNSIIPGVSSGADVFHPPASIVARAPGDPDAPANLTLANTDMHFQSTYSTSYRNGTTSAGGTIPRTFISSSEGNTIIAAKTDGKVTLRPVRDYGDTGTATSFVENRFAHELHEYHEFLGAGFLSGRAGTLVEIQPKSGETGGSTDFNYDSKGDATLRLSTHEANNSLKTYWDITNEHIGGNLQISQDGTGVIEVNGSHSVFTNIPVMPSHSNTALPTSVAGGIIYVTNGNNKPAYGDGTNWYYYDNTTVT